MHFKFFLSIIAKKDIEEISRVLTCQQICTSLQGRGKDGARVQIAPSIFRLDGAKLKIAPSILEIMQGGN